MAKIKTAIQFALVYVPVTLHSCTKKADIGFNLIHKKTGQRIKYKKTCEDCPAKVDPEDIVKGYQYEKDKYVVLTDEELAKLKSKKEENINILQFSKLEEIDPILYEDSYFVEATGAKNAYALLCKALAAEKKVGIAKAVLGQSECLLALRVIDGVLVASKLHFADEVLENPVAKTTDTVNKQELEMAKQLVENLTKKFDIADYKNEYKERVVKAINNKIAGQKVVGVKKENPKTIVNLMDALKASLKQSEEDDKIITISKRKSKKGA